VKRVALSLLGFYAIYAAAMVAAHTSLIYPFFATDQVLRGFLRVELTAEDGTEISVQEAQGDGPIVLYFMGNAGALSAFDPPLQTHAAAGRHVIAMEYRGGAGRPGVPDETVLKSDALKVADWALAKGKPLVLHGYSLGTGLAVHVASSREVAQVVLEAPFDRLCALMARRSVLPACFMPGVQRWDTLADAPSVRAPVLILHGSEDVLIPPERSHILANAFSSVERHLLDGAGHLDVFSRPAAQTIVQQAFDRLAD
jgi:pimeloyl-ACP methyl ester carboxylesterase